MCILCRYFYNTSTNACERFVYGGCDGNENNFHVRLACEAICKRPNVTEEKEILVGESSFVSRPQLAAFFA